MLVVVADIDGVKGRSGALAMAGALLLSLLWFAAPASAQTDDPYADVPIYEMTFPVVGPSYFSDTFDACRDGCSRTHGATDIMTYGWKGVPIIAAHSGTIIRTTESSGRPCCAIWGLRADDGWQTWYIHMNNDTPFTDDALGEGFAPGIEVGAWVEEGQLLGWVGDSGNAEHISPHLHFELRAPDGTRVNPYPSLLQAKRTFFDRVAGDDRFSTAVEVSQNAFPGGADVAFVATAYAFPDALSGGAAAVAAGGPVLLSAPGSVPGTTLDELRRLDPETIYLLGGEGALSANVQAQLEAVAPVTRLAGPDRFATAAAIASAFFTPDTGTVYVASGLSHADAVAGAPAAALDGAPLLLVDTDSVPAATADELLRLGPDEIVVLGGTGVVSASVEGELGAYAETVTRIAGQNRYATAAAISQRSHPDGASTVYLATGLGYVDALAGVSLAFDAQAPILLAGTDLPGQTAAEIARLGADTVVLLGGLGALPAEVDMGLWNLFNGNDMPIWK